jgi:hypothetical protein
MVLTTDSSSSMRISARILSNDCSEILRRGRAAEKVGAAVTAPWAQVRTSYSCRSSTCTALLPRGRAYRQLVGAPARLQRFISWITRHWSLAHTGSRRTASLAGS